MKPFVVGAKAFGIRSAAVGMVNSFADRLPPHVPEPTTLTGVAALLGGGLLALGYFLFGEFALSLQSSQAGVSPIWPASGLAFAMSFWFGPWVSLGILPAMFGLALSNGIGYEVAAVAGVASVLEVVLPALLLRHLAVSPALGRVRDVTAFVLLAAVIGPVISAVAGTLVMIHWSVTAANWSATVLTWWLGNSVGILVLGSSALVLPVCWRGRRGSVRRQWGLPALLVASAAVMQVSVLLMGGVSSSLALYLLVPIFIVAAVRFQQAGVALVAFTALLVLALGSEHLPSEILASTELGAFFLNVSLLWVITLTGFAVAAAYSERDERNRVVWLATHDPMTQLVNRHKFTEHLERALQGVRRFGNPSALIFLDLDRFKAVNDAEGHAVGDELIKEISRLMAAAVRTRDTVGRLGGDEFAVLLEHCPISEAVRIAEGIREVVEGYEFIGDNGRYRVQASLGVLELRHTIDDAGLALRLADSACYTAKRMGRNRVHVYDGSLAWETPAG